jgi:hypothetical protein
MLPTPTLENPCARYFNANLTLICPRVQPKALICVGFFQTTRCQSNAGSTPQPSHLTPTRREFKRVILGELTSIGRLAQLGERCVRNAEVGGSIPPPSTKTFS